jgi:hypothetical protein
MKRERESKEREREREKKREREKREKEEREREREVSVCSGTSSIICLLSGDPLPTNIYYRRRRAEDGSVYRESLCVCVCVCVRVVRCI